MNSSRPMLQNPSFSQPGQAFDQHSMKLALQSCLERLDKLDRRVHEEIQETHSIFMDLLDNRQSDVAMGDSGTYDSTIDSKAGLGGPNAIPQLVSLHDRCFVPQPASNRSSFGVTGSLSEGTGHPKGLLPRSSANYRPAAQYSLTQPQHSMYSEALSSFHHGDTHITELSLEGAGPSLGQLFQNSPPHGTPDPVHEFAVQPFQSMYFEEYVSSSSSARPDEQLSAPITQASQVKEKVKCAWNGCSAFINKDSLTRHIEEMHEGKIKAVCAGCGREFKRLYQMDEHIRQSRCGKS